jgi:glycosyltransferase involved in cell wall biosynthesis
MSLKISVVIPVYNASKTIVSTINSVLNQSYKVFEIILINDGSTDDSLKIIKKNFFQHIEDKFIVLVDKVNEGPSKARNIGVGLAASEWIAFLDSDDHWHESKLEKQVVLIEKNENVKICGTSSNISSFPRKDLFFFVTYKDLLYKNYFCTSSVLIKKEVFKESGGFDVSQKYSEDYGLWLEILHLKNDGIILNEKLLEYNTNEGERLSSQSFLMTKGEFYNYKKQFKRKRIGFVFWCCLNTLSIIKYIKRLIV